MHCADIIRAWIIKTTSYDGISKWNLCKKEREKNSTRIENKVKNEQQPSHKHTYKENTCTRLNSKIFLLRTAINNAVKSFYHLIFIQQLKRRRIEQTRDRRIKRARERKRKSEKNSRKKQTSNADKKTQREKKQCMMNMGKEREITKKESLAYSRSPRRFNRINDYTIALIQSFRMYNRNFKIEIQLQFALTSWWFFLCCCKFYFIVIRPNQHVVSHHWFVSKS